MVDQIPLENGVSNGIHSHYKSTDEVKDVGIVAIEFYFPKSYVSQTDLEKFDNASPNKYTSGLGQSEMCFCHENEDVCSISLSAVAGLMENYKVNPKDIGFLAVGSETLVDKSKSVKSVLMQLFAESGNTDLEGVDEKNACFGGTQALLHAVDWLYSNYEFDGRKAIVVCADIAVYEPGPARCTGGAGAIAFLLAPNAPVAFDRGLRAFHSEDVYDFYKPVGGPSTQFPRVNGPNSVETYLNSLDKCYARFIKKWAHQSISKGKCSLAEFDAVIFHSPYTRLTQKAFSWLSFVDYKRDLCNDAHNWQQLDNSYKDMTLSEIFQLERKKKRTDGDRFTDKILELSARAADQKLNPNLEFSRRIGNMYTPSLYAQLVNVFLNTNFAPNLDQHRILLFSYGSGCIAALFSLRFNFSADNSSASFASIKQGAQRARQRLDQRVKHTPEQFTEALGTRERILSKGETYTGKKDDGEHSPPLFKGAYYLREIDSELRRFYARNVE